MIVFLHILFADMVNTINIPLFPGPPQVVWPSEFQATVNVTVNESATLQFYNLSFSKRFNAEIRVFPQNGSILTDHNSSRSFVITTESPPSCIESPSQWPIFYPDLSTFN